jgi:hypothetical protein
LNDIVCGALFFFKVQELRRCKIVLLFELKSQKEYVEGKSNKDPEVNLAVKDVVLS